MGVCNCSMFCCTLLHVNSSFAIILLGKRALVVLLSLSSMRIVVVVWLFFRVPWVCLQFVIVVFPDHTHLLFLIFGYDLTILVGLFFQLQLILCIRLNLIKYNNIFILWSFQNIVSAESRITFKPVPGGTRAVILSIKLYE